MSTPAAPRLPGIRSKVDTDHDERPSQLSVSLLNHALAGAAASSLLALVELVDLSFRLTPVFQSFLERAVFCAYFSLNVAGGLVIGVVVGLLAYAASLLKKTTQRVLARRNAVRLIHKLIAAAGVSVISAFALNQQPRVRAYILEIIREAEKIESLTVPLLNHERTASYLLLIGLVAACSIVWMTTQAMSGSTTRMRVRWALSLVVFIACAYYVDSRFETQQYGTSIHRSMFLLSTALGMSLIGSLAGSLFASTSPSSFFHPRTRSFRPAVASPFSTATLIGGSILLIASVVFTFAHFGKNQNLKTQIFYRTTQAQQYFRLAQWALDFDRDGYSSYLGGGDCDDRRADINPRAAEVAGGGIDHNCIGGALTQQDIDDWNLEHGSLHKPPDAAARRFNVIYVFIDALRADHLSAYGYNRNTSPNLDKLAARSSLFKNAYTPAPNTFEALPKFTQGTYWDAHLEGWPEIMARGGYDALLFPRRIATLTRHVKGMTVADSARTGTFEGSIDAAINVLVNTPRTRPFCAYLYSTDTHRPYKPHEEFYYGQSMVDLYDGEISYLDFHLGRLFDAMEKAGKFDDTIVVIMADHGESLGERGVYKHSSQLYNEQSRVPMIIHLPGSPARLIADYVSTIDLGPSILNAVGLDYPRECAGVSLVPLMRGETFTHPPVYGEQTTQEVSPFVRPDQQLDPGQKKYMMITQDGFKLIYNRDYYNFELFNLEADPAELRNLYDQMPERAAEMKKRLGRFIDVVTVSRPRDADESQYFFGPTGETREAK